MHCSSSSSSHSVSSLQEAPRWQGATQVSVMGSHDKPSAQRTSSVSGGGAGSSRSEKTHVSPSSRSGWHVPSSCEQYRSASQAPSSKQGSPARPGRTHSPNTPSSGLPKHTSPGWHSSDTPGLVQPPPSGTRPMKIRSGSHGVSGGGAGNAQASGSSSSVSSSLQGSASR